MVTSSVYTSFCLHAGGGCGVPAALAPSAVAAPCNVASVPANVILGIAITIAAPPPVAPAVETLVGPWADVLEEYWWRVNVQTISAQRSADQGTVVAPAARPPPMGGADWFEQRNRITFPLLLRPVLPCAVQVRCSRRSIRWRSSVSYSLQRLIQHRLCHAPPQRLFTRCWLVLLHRHHR